MNKIMRESASVEDMGQFFYHLDPDIRKITRRLEKLQLKAINSVPSALIKLVFITTCCQKKIPQSIYLSIYIYIYIYIYMYIICNQRVCK